MSKVFITTYEVIGAHEIATAHYAAVDNARNAHWAFVKKVGGSGYQPGYGGGVVAVLFEQLPAGWRQICTEKNWIKAVPHKATREGKAVYEKMKALPVPPSPEQLCADYGYQPSEFPIEGTTIYFATALRVTFPSERIFLRIPRTASDGFEPNEAHLRALPESEFMAAIEAHNAEAKRQHEAKEGGAA